jgi:DNA polymerase elongation subunit (family B)
MGKFYTHVHQYRGKMLVRGYDDNGFRVHRQIPYSPYLFIPAKPGQQTEFRSLQGQPLNRMRFGTIKEAREFVKEYEGIENFNIFGSTDWVPMYIYDSYKGAIEFDPEKISIGILDIETGKQEGGINPKNPNAEITAISLRKNGKTVTFGFKDFNPPSEDIAYNKCDHETQLLHKFLDVWEEFDLDVVTGWNVDFFDIPYLVNRITLLMGADQAARLSPWGLMDERLIILRGKEEQVYVPLGVTILDYPHLYRKFSKDKNAEDWKLNTIANKELSVKKIDYSEYDNIFELYLQNPQKFYEYNVVDVDLVDKLEQKLGYIKSVFHLAYDAKTNYTDTLATVKPWDVIIHNYLLEKGICVPPKEPKHMNRDLVGGYVKEVKPGVYNWVMSFDFDSLYPHLIILLNIGPDTYAGKGFLPGWSVDSALAGKLNHKDIAKGQDLAVGANLAMYKKDKQSFLAHLMESKYSDRAHLKDEAKKYKNLANQETDPAKKKEYSNLSAMYNGRQLARKEQLNSAYGALTNLWFRWFDLDNAEAITMTGQLAIRWMERAVNGYLNKVLGTNKDRVIAIDTDSIYVTFDDLVNKVFPNGGDPQKITDFLDKVSKEKIQQVINKACLEVFEYLNAYKPALKMKRETIADRALWTAAKNYMLNAYDIEGERFKEPELKVTGIKAVMPSTPQVVREAMKKTFKILMTGNQEELHDFINKFRSEFVGKPFNEIAMPRGVKGLEKYHDAASVYKSATPIHVRASLVYNKLIRDFNLISDYEQIYSGDKIKFGYLKVPNPCRENVIAVLNALPKEFGLDRFIDYDLQFRKTYLDPLNDIIAVAGWTTEKKATLDDFF